MQGWNMALKNAELRFPERAEDVDALIKQRISGNLKVKHPDGSAATLCSQTLVMGACSMHVPSLLVEEPQIESGRLAYRFSQPRHPTHLVVLLVYFEDVQVGNFPAHGDSAILLVMMSACLSARC